MYKTMYKSLLAITLLFAACTSKETKVETAVADVHDPNLVAFTQDQYNAANVQLGKVTITNLGSYIKASGTIDVPPSQSISITSPYGGTIKSTSVIEGKYINKGQVIATIENPEFLQMQQDYLESSSQLAFLKQDLARQEELVKENIAARKSLQKASSEYNSMVARVEGLKSKLRLANINPANIRPGNFTPRVSIHAPISGYVTHVYANVGKYVGPNEVLADMASTKNIFAKIRVFEKDLPKIKMGQTVRFKATGDSMERNAKVFLIGKDIDADRTIQVSARILDPSPNLIPGMFINAIVEVGAAETTALPQQAVVQAGGTNYIFVLEENSADTVAAANKKNENSKDAAEESAVKFRRVEVGAGVTENGFTAVTLPAKFNMESKVVIKGAYDLLSKMNNTEEEE
ncbi:efflux RND transporter periplasmic adaptor subunit [Hydrotalea lipotrueae]|jgi:cobalt-zinc-cadmium efflux system membrane fusion protein|uniref:efflux RND transporter periplasmic adaptor subunit n=1 Tax=Hydrotalea lipotrueae TaxID=2803817 RepID=UPI001C47F8D2|nr:efflux RND transporter periplasmic adaptor subunit [Hydrotalea lipotrueae]